MGLARWMFNDWFTAHELEVVDRRLEQHAARLEREADLNAEAIGLLRADLERLALLTHSLAELCLENKVLTREQLKQRMLDLDLRDGVQDGLLRGSGGLGQVE